MEKDRVCDIIGAHMDYSATTKQNKELLSLIQELASKENFIEGLINQLNKK